MKIFREVDQFNPEEPFTIYHNEEIWFPLEFEDLMSNTYEISNFSRIRMSNKHNYEFPEIYVGFQGYAYVNLRDYTGKKKSYRHHRLVAAAFCIKQHESYNVVNHLDSTRDNNDFRNLEWCTQQMNIRHAYENGRTHAKPGEKHFNSKYSDEFIHQICNLMSQGYSNDQILQLLNIDQKEYKSIRKLFTKIRTRATHTDISDNYPNIILTQKHKTFDDDTVRRICELFQQNPNLMYKEVIEILGLEPSRASEKALSRIKTRDGYTDISIDYNW